MTSRPRSYSTAGQPCLMDLFFGQLIAGLSYGSTLFLVSAGLTLIFGVTRVVNFAHGSLYMLGAYIAYTITDAVDPKCIQFFRRPAFGGARGCGCWRLDRSGLASAPLLVARNFPAARDLWRRVDRAGRCVGDLGPDGTVRAARAGTKGRIEIAGALRSPVFDLRLIVGPCCLRAAVVGDQPHAVGRMGASRCARSRDRWCTGLERACALYVGVRAWRISRRSRRSVADPARNRQFANGPRHSDRSVRRGRRRWPGFVTGAFWSALLIGLLHAFGSWWLPQSTLVLIFVVMAVVLILDRMACWVALKHRSRLACIYMHRPWRRSALAASLGR